MSDKTAIEWTDATWNPVRGCSRVSEGCRNCYAEKIATRFSSSMFEGFANIGPRPGAGGWTGKVELIPDKLSEPLGWRKPRRVFVNSMSDLFHEKLSNEDIAAVFRIMWVNAQEEPRDRHTFQILTKRPARMLAWFHWLEHARPGSGSFLLSQHPLPNVWLGVSVEDQATADDRIPLLLQTPAAVRFISAEPLLGPVDFSDMFGRYREIGDRVLPCPDWVIVGGESGPGARPMHPRWAESLRDQCFGANVPFFFKQWGEFEHFCMTYATEPTGEPTKFRVFPDGYAMRRVGKKAAGRLLDGRTWDEFPGARP